MATITATNDTFGAEAKGRGLFRRLFDRLIEARQAQAERAVAAHLLSLDDVTLDKLGYDRAALRASGPGACTSY